MNRFQGFLDADNKNSVLNRVDCNPNNKCQEESEEDRMFRFSLVCMNLNLNIPFMCISIYLFVSIYNSIYENYFRLLLQTCQVWWFKLPRKIVGFT